MKIIYPNPDGTLVIIMPTGLLSVEETARKDVPAGVPYLILLDSDLPTDWSTSAAWEADFTSPDGHGIGAVAWFAEKAQREAAEQAAEAAQQAAVAQDVLTTLGGAQ